MEESAEVVAEREAWLNERLAWLQEGGAKAADGRLVVPLTGAAKAIRAATDSAKRVFEAFEHQRRQEEADHKARLGGAGARAPPSLSPGSPGQLSTF
eukprot:scaffold309148_cov35-Tisochrysis_lutea.AAC.2